MPESMTPSATWKIITPRRTCSIPSLRCPRIAISVQTAEPSATRRRFLQREVGHGREQGRPVPTHLIRSTKASVRPDRILECVVGGEMRDDRLEVVLAGGAMQASHDVEG